MKAFAKEALSLATVGVLIAGLVVIAGVTAAGNVLGLKAQF